MLNSARYLYPALNRWLCVEISSYYYIFLKMIHKVPLYLIFIGGVKGIRYALPEVLLNPILSDSFGFSDEKTSLYFFLLVFVFPIGTIIL